MLYVNEMLYVKNTTALHLHIVILLWPFPYVKPWKVGEANFCEIPNSQLNAMEKHLANRKPVYFIQWRFF